MKHLLLIATGGTIASRRGDQGLEPQISARGLLEYMSDLRAHYHIDARDILNLDSSNIQAEEWQTIARAVMENLDAYDGIVITHGTDTMAYTASVLSYMLQNLTKPVVLTGSQMPIDNLLTDAVRTIYLADPPINVCPSIHCFNSIGVNIAIRRSELGRRHKAVRWGSEVLMVLICMSTVFIKQHSIADVFAAILLAVPFLSLIHI